MSQAAKRAVGLLKAKPLKGGQRTVILDPVLAASFVHEAFGHLSEADNVYENDKLKELMYMGRKFGGEHLNFTDGAAQPGMRGSYKIDDEGTPAALTPLVRDGVLVGRLHSRETAAKTGEAPTGNARAISYRFPPIVRMTNTFIENGEATFRRSTRGCRRWCLCKELVRRHDSTRDVHVLVWRGLHDPKRRGARSSPTSDALRQPL